MRREIGALAVVAVFISAGRLAAAPVEWPVSSGGNEHLYEVVSVASPISWIDARDSAAAKGGYLVSITSAAESAFVFNLVSDPKYWSTAMGPWIGAYQYDKLHEPAGDWAWASGELWGYTNWKSGEPNNAGGFEDYAALARSSPGVGTPYWNDLANVPNVPDRPVLYIVEYPVPEPSTLALLGMGAAGLLAYAWRRQKVA